MICSICLHDERHVTYAMRRSWFAGVYSTEIAS